MNKKERYVEFIGNEMYFWYDHVGGSIPFDWINENGIKAYIDDEVFEETVRNCISSDTSLQEHSDDEDFIKEYRDKVGKWLLSYYLQNKDDINEIVSSEG